MRLAYWAIAVGALALAFAGNLVLAGVYALAAGFGIGAVSPLVGMHSKNVFGDKSLGTAMGLLGLVFLLANAVGPLAAAWIATSFGSRSVPVVIAAILVAVAALVVRKTD